MSEKGIKIEREREHLIKKENLVMREKDKSENEPNIENERKKNG